jgi:hypothetical protein
VDKFLTIQEGEGLLAIIGMNQQVQGHQKKNPLVPPNATANERVKKRKPTCEPNMVRS